MQSLVIIIILLSLIGLYINLGTFSDLSKPELNKLDLEELMKADSEEKLSPDQIADEIMKEVNKPPEFDAMGNLIKTGDGLDAGKEILNLNVENGAAPNTRPDKWARPSNKEIGPYGLSRNNLSYKNNFPYEAKYLQDIQAEEMLKSRITTMARNPKATANVSQIILPKDPSKIKEGLGFTERAVAIIRNQVANENKILPDVRKIDENNVTHRASKNIHRVIPDKLEIKDKPDTLESQSTINRLYAHNRSKKHDESKHAIKTMTTNYNFK